MTTVALYHREEAIRRRLNAFFRDAFQLPEADYYRALNLNALLGLKSVLSDINNTLTMRLTLGFVAWATEALSLDTSTAALLRNKILSMKPSSNGYDVHCASPRPFIAEVKCNVPINGGAKYGAAQKAGIISDIDALLHGKSKASPVEPNSLKFMVFLDVPEVRAGNDHLVASNSKLSKAFAILKSGEVPNDPKVVYGVYVGLGA